MHCRQASALLVKPAGPDAGAAAFDSGGQKRSHDGGSGLSRERQTGRRLTQGVFFVIHHGRRRILHFATTFNPTSQWVILQLREAFLFDDAPRFLIFDQDSIFSAAVVNFIKSMGTKPSQTAYRSPWQNPFAERWILGAKRELFDHVIIFGERHATRLAREYLAYHHEDRCHLGLDKDTPTSGR